MQKLIFFIVLLALGAACFSGLKGAGFVWNDRATVLGDDGDTTTDSAAVLTQKQRLAAAWKLHRGDAFEPLAPSVWMLAARETAKSPNPTDTAGLARTDHLLSLGFHLASGLLVFLILALVLQSQGAAFVGALLFVMHPLQVESVAYVSAFKFVLGGFFALLAIWQYLVFVSARDNTRSRSRPYRSYYLATVAFALAVLACSAMVVTPLLAWLLQKLLPKKTSLIATRTPAWPLVVWLLMAVAPLVWTIGSENTQALASQLPFWAKPVVAADAVSFYLSKIFAPVLIGPDYGRSPAYVLSHWWGFFTWILPVTLLLVLAYWRSKASNWYWISAMILIAAVLPFLGLYYFEAQATSTVASRFAYLAMLGPALAAGYTVSMPKKSWLPALVAIAVVACGYLSHAELKHWRTDEALWNHAVSVNPTSPIAHQTLGDGYRRQGDWQKAREHYEKVLESNALTPDIHFYLGEIERLHGDPKKSVGYYKRTLELDPQYAEAWVRLGLAYLEEGKNDEALAHFRKAVELSPESEEPLRHLGLLYVRKGQYAEAIPYLTKALRLGEAAGDPKAQAATHALLGLALARTHQPEIAQGHLETALKLDPDHADTNRTLADIYFGQGKYELALPRYEKVVAQGVKDYEVFDNLGRILAMNKQHSKAVLFFNKALELKPDSPETLKNVGISYFRVRQFKDATESFHKALALNPNMADPHYFLGDMLRWQGKEPEAISEYYRALKIEPTHADANYRLGNYFMKENKIAQAIHHYQEALRVAPEDPKLIYSLKKAEKAKQGGPGDSGGTAEF